MLLDTCALLWLAREDKHLSDQARQRIIAAPIVYVSAISGFELALKCRAGKLTLPMPALQWFSQLAIHHDLCVLELSLDVCVRAAELPPIHKDPCDRFIIATAMANDLSVVTADPRFAEYGIVTLC